MKKSENHRHHIIPKHAGGSDNDDNIIIVDRKTHAKLHYQLYQQYNKKEDLCAYHMLCGNMEEFRSVYASLGGTAIQKQRKLNSLDCFGQNKEQHKINASKGGRIQGNINTKNGHIQYIQKLVDKSAAGRKGSSICKQLKKNAFFDSNLRQQIASLGGKTQGTNNIKSGHIQKLSQNNIGTKWITNGIQNKRLKINSSMPQGFTYGITHK